MGKVEPSALTSKRVVITRAAVQSEALALELSSRGAIPIVLPLIQFAVPEDFAPLDAAIQQMERFDWLIFTSAQAVRAVVKRSTETERPVIRTGNKLRIAAVGPVSAEAAREAGLPVTYVAETHSGVVLAEELGNRLKDCKVLLPRSDRANPELPVTLERFGAQVTEVIAYRTIRASEVDKESLRKMAEGEADAILFFSPSAVQEFAGLYGSEQLKSLQDKLAITAVGPVTANALSAAGVQRMVLAGDTTAAAVMQTLEEHFSDLAKHASAGVKRG